MSKAHRGHVSHSKYLHVCREDAVRLFEIYKNTKAVSLTDLVALPNNTTGIHGVTAMRNLFTHHFPDEYPAVAEWKGTHLYYRGRAFEYRCMKWLKAKGYFVLRAPQSKGIADLVAIKPGLVLLIQCKNRPHLPEDEQSSLVELAHSVGARPIFLFSETYRAPILAVNLDDVHLHKPHRWNSYATDL